MGLLVNTLAADDKYLALNRDNLTIPIQMQLYQKQKTFSQLFPAFLKSRLNYKHFERREYPHRFCIFEITDSENVGPVSEDLSTSNMADMPKHFLNLRHSTFIIFIDRCQVNWVGKSFFYWHAKFWYWKVSSS